MSPASREMQSQSTEEEATIDRHPGIEQYSQACVLPG
jgi:hypothetical protein